MAKISKYGLEQKEKCESYANEIKLYRTITQDPAYIQLQEKFNLDEKEINQGFSIVEINQSRITSNSLQSIPGGKIYIAEVYDQRSKSAQIKLEQLNKDKQITIDNFINDRFKCPAFYHETKEIGDKCRLPELNPLSSFEIDGYTITHCAGVVKNATIDTLYYHGYMSEA